MVTTALTEMTSGWEDIRYREDDQVAWITIDRPEVYNALRTRTYEELTAAVNLAADRSEVGVIVITGAGEKAFSSGGDVRDQRGRDPAGGRAHLRRVLALGTAMRGCGKPVVAAVRGYCVGGGHELHLMCDLTVAAEGSTFGQVGPRVGMVPIWGATEILPRVVGEKRARELLYTTRLIDAQEALAIGLVNRVVPAERLEAEVRELCDRMLEMSPQSLRIAKLSVNYAVDAMWPAFTHGAELVSMLYGSDEQVEGATAFAEKRRPDYRGMRARPVAAATTEDHEDRDDRDD
jgi:naphthoate synthase/2-ketocyclohexanecarboxyl-CoA hydrolase